MKDNDSIYLVIKGKEYQIEKKLISNETLLTNLISNLEKFQDKSSITKQRYNLPNNIERRSFDAYLNLIINKNLYNIEDIVNALTVSTDLNDISSASEILTNSLTTSLNNNKSINLSEEIKIITYINQEFEKNINILELNNLYKNTIDLLKTKIIDRIFFNNFYDESIYQKIYLQLIKLPQNILQEIIPLAFKRFILNFIPGKSININLLTSILIKLLIYFFKIHSYNNDNILNLLDVVNEYSVKLFNNSKDNNLDYIEWNIDIDSFNNDFFYPSSIYYIGNVSVKLYIQYSKNTDELTAAIEIIKDNNKSNKDYYPISILTKGLINDTLKQKTYFNCIYPYSSTKALIIKIDNFYKDNKDKFNNNTNKLNLKIFYSFNYIYSSIIYYICCNFDKYFNDKENNILNKLHKNVLLVILKNHLCHASEESEDKVFMAIINWILCKKDSFFNFPDKNLSFLLDCFDIQKVSIDCLLNIIINYGSLIDSFPESLGSVIKKEINRRFIDTYEHQNISNTSTLEHINTNLNENYQEKFTSELIDKIINITNNIKQNNDQNNIICINTNSTNSSIINNSINNRKRSFLNNNIYNRKINKSNNFNTNNNNNDENISLVFPLSPPKINDNIKLVNNNYNSNNKKNKNSSNNHTINDNIIIKKINPSFSNNSSNSYINTQYLVSTTSNNNGVNSTDNSSLNSRNNKKKINARNSSNLNKNQSKNKLNISNSTSPYKKLFISTNNNDLISNLFPFNNQNKTYSLIQKQRKLNKNITSTKINHSNNHKQLNYSNSINTDMRKSNNNNNSNISSIYINNNTNLNSNVNSNANSSHNKSAAYACFSNTLNKKKTTPKLAKNFFSPQNIRNKIFINYNKDKK